MSAAHRRSQILDATLALAAEDGYRGMSVEAIARAAGITRPVVYGLFGDLPSLLRELHERESATALGQLAGVEPTRADPDGAAVEALRRFLAAVRAEPNTWRLILLPVDGMPDALRDRMQRDRALVLHRIEELVRWGVRARGGVGDRAAAEPVDVELLALAVRTLAEEAGRLVLTEPGRFPDERLVAFAAHLLAAVPHGVPAHAPPPAPGAHPPPSPVATAPPEAPA